MVLEYLLDDFPKSVSDDCLHQESENGRDRGQRPSYIGVV